VIRGYVGEGVTTDEQSQAPIDFTVNGDTEVHLSLAAAMVSPTPRQRTSTHGTQ